MDQVTKPSERLKLQLEGANQNQNLSDSPSVYGIHAHLLSFGGDVIHELSEDPRIRETAVPTLLCSEGIALEPSMIEQIRCSWTVRRAILHHQL